MHGLNLKRHTRLEGGKIGTRHGSSGRQSDSRCNLARNTGGNNATAAELGLDDTNVGSVKGTPKSQHIAGLVGRVHSLRANGDVLVDLVKKTNVVGRKLVRCRERGENGALGVARSEAKVGQAATGKAIGDISTNFDALSWNSKAGRGVDLGHVHDIEHRGHIEVSLGVIDAEIRSLAGLEGELDFRANTERGLDSVSSIGSMDKLVDVELGVGELVRELGGEASSLTRFRLDADSHWSGILLGLEQDLRREVIRQEICKETR